MATILRIGLYYHCFRLFLQKSANVAVNIDIMNISVIFKALFRNRGDSFNNATNLEHMPL